MLKEDGAPVKGAIVTGAGRGIGRAAALAYAWEGASLAICSGSADELASSRWPSTSGGLADGVRRDPPHGAAEGRERDQRLLRPRPWSLPRVKRATTAEQLVPWISDPLNVVLDQENPEVINAALKAYFNTYVTTGQRLSRVA